MASSNNTTMSTEEYIEMLREEMIPETIVYTASWIVGTAGNLFILQQLHSNNVPKSKINFMIKHLAIADLIVIWFTITIEIAWRICVTWNTPDYGCRILQMMRTFGLYLTSMIVISITLDRFYAFVYPMSVFDSKHRNRKFLILSYVIATACSIPNVSSPSPNWLSHADLHPSGRNITAITPILLMCKYLLICRKLKSWRENSFTRRANPSILPEGREET